ncbi:alpha/beta fold hydrolase [Wenjunlia tyrosinilytica]|uniref:Uncharacterized protein n=1 Tax=Wenjunlia tyrosinilytica TaxID=1544741 RepID=A0A917ZYM6_9ACTN|nr:alpha/beta fold hydrolase [Wenjunlia tyrosinilytica]GGO98952.1 hypothetical protein GCM10012280_64270 [Wenjunlia tyrosinilytica]
MKRQVGRVLVGILSVPLAAALIAGCGSLPAPSADDSAHGAGDVPAPALNFFHGQRIAWNPCPDDPRTKESDETGFQCGWLRVPLDYARPGGDVLDMALVRRPASRTGRRAGTLLVNPGAPGSSGVEGVTYGFASFGRSTHERFDVLGFDPRGVGQTAPSACLRRRPDQCLEQSREVLRHRGTSDVARDLEVLRAVLVSPWASPKLFGDPQFPGASGHPGPQGCGEGSRPPRVARSGGHGRVPVVVLCPTGRGAAPASWSRKVASGRADALLLSPPRTSRSL